jgi:hypothetical protein
MPEAPTRFLDLKRIDHGAMFEGTKGVLVSDFTSRILYPAGDKADMTYYKPRGRETLVPKMGGFQQQWLKACKGDLKTSCDFEYSGNMIEQLVLGLVAYRVGKRIKYDGANGRVLDNPEADALLRRTYRQGWTLNG